MKRVFSVVICIIMLMGLSACSVDRMPKDYVMIKTGYPKGIVNQEYDFEKYINKLDEMTYSQTVEQEENRLTVDGYSFKPTAVGVVKVTVVGRKNRTAKKETVQIDIIESGGGGDIGIKDFSESPYVSSRKPPNYGTTAALTEDSVFHSTGSKKSLRGVFNNDGADTFNNSAWTWVEFNVRGAGFSNLSNKSFKFDVSMENCGIKSSIILEDTYGRTSSEIFFSITAGSAIDPGVKKTANGDFLTITIDLNFLFGNSGAVSLSSVDNILIMFSNYEMSYWQDSVFHMDNVGVADSGGTGSDEIPVYNPSGTYSKSEHLNVLFCGNSFISTSETPIIFRELCNNNGANVDIITDSIGYGRVRDHWGVFNYVDVYGVDVIFFQDFYGADDIPDLGVFLQMINDYGASIEVVIYPAENETDDGMRASKRYGLDIVNWKAAIKEVKRSYPQWTGTLNYPDDPIVHSSPVAGLIGAIMQYMALYGEVPDYGPAIMFVENNFGWFLPGNTLDQKIANVQDVIQLVQNL